MPDLSVAATSPLRFTLDLLLGALVFVVALAWNNAVQAIAQSYFGVDDTIVGLLWYAIIITVILIISAYLVQTHIYNR